MKTLSDTKNELKLLLPEGIDVAIKGTKAALAIGTDKYNDLLLLEGRYQDISRQLLQGIISDEAANLEFNKIRKELLDFIDSLMDNHLATAQKAGVDGKPDIYNGEVLYRIPKQMQKNEETKCLVRLAFDRNIITQDLEKHEGDVLKDLRISEVMGVELLDPIGDAFEIRTLSDTVQFVEQDLFTEWIFFVKPIAEGMHDLVLKISIIEIKNGIERKRNVVLEEKVEIIATVPEKSGVAEEFAKAGIAMAVAHDKGGAGTREIPLPGSKEFFPPSPPPAPMPTPAPAPAIPRTGSSIRKIGTILSAFVVLVVSAMVMWNVLTPSYINVNPNDSGNIASADREEWNKIKNNPNQSDVKDFLKNHPESDLSNRAKIVLDSLDNQAWQAALASKDVETMRNYVRQFPEGKNVERAASMIHEMENGLAEKTDPPTTKQPQPTTKKDNDRGGTKVKPKGQNTGNVSPPNRGVKPSVDNGSGGITPTDPDEIIPMRLASRLPVYPRCKNDNQEKEKACTEQSIGKFISKNLQYPEEAKRQKIEGTVTVEFTVEKDGKITSVQYRNDIGGGCAKEAVRLVQRFPKFEPGLNGLGQPVRVRYVLPIRFTLR
ncbi:MAG: TonB family protein [Saprospiraceae bacterium]